VGAGACAGRAGGRWALAGQAGVGELGRAGGSSWAAEKKGGGLGWIKGLGPLSFSILFQHTQTKLNSNSNLNSTLALNQIKEMLQHDATTKIKPMINFNYLRNKIRLNASLTQ
jgi:hypothetical protein